MLDVNPYVCLSRNASILNNNLTLSHLQMKSTCLVLSFEQNELWVSHDVRVTMVMIHFLFIFISIWMITVFVLIWLPSPFVQRSFKGTQQMKMKTKCKKGKREKYWWWWGETIKAGRNMQNTFLQSFKLFWWNSKVCL